MTERLPKCSGLRLGLLLALLLGWCVCGTSRADTVQYNVSFNDPNAFQFDSGSTPYALDFYLGGDNGTTVSGSNFSGSGTDASTNFTLGASAEGSEAIRTFSPPTTSPAGSLLSFDIFANYTPGSLDTFSFGIYKNYGPQDQMLITTTEPGQGISFFTIDFGNPSGPFVSTYGSNDPGFNIAAPTVRVVATPEPETWAMMAMGLAALGLLGWKRKRRESSQAEPFTVSI